MERDTEPVSSQIQKPKVIDLFALRAPAAYQAEAVFCTSSLQPMQ